MLRHSIVVGGCLCGVVLLAGCGGGGPSLTPAKGTVKYKKLPVEGAVVTFRSDALSALATGTTDSDGAFELTTYKKGKGAIPGNYKVTVTKVPAAPVSEKAGGMESMLKTKSPPAPKNQLPKIYEEMTTTPLKFSISADAAEMPIDLSD